MKANTSYYRYSLAQLRGMLRDTDAQQSPQRYRRLQLAIRAREERRRQYLADVAKLGEEEGSDFLVWATVFAWCAYGLPFICILLFFLVWLDASSPNSLLLVLGLIASVVVAWGLAELGMAVMRRQLREFNKRTVVKAWSLFAAALAPASTYSYLYVIPQLLDSSLEIRFWTTFEGTIPFLICGAAGFYMPFVLLTLWLKYRYRQDEF